MKKELTELVFILDKSGSMAGLEKDTIGGFNSWLLKQKEISSECFVTTALFDNNYQLIHDRINIKHVTPLSSDDYQAGGTTALLDAIGRTIRQISDFHEILSAEVSPNVLVVIITDGEENASCEYSEWTIRKIIENQKINHGWEFIFLGANIDAFETAGRFGISRDRAQNYYADQAGIEANFETLAVLSANYIRFKDVDDNWQTKIQDDFNRRNKKK